MPMAQARRSAARATVGHDGLPDYYVCHDLKVAAKFSDLPGVIHFVARHREKIEDFTIVGADQAAWQECSPFYHPSDCE